jgi:hypothetical protein
MIQMTNAIRQNGGSGIGDSVDLGGWEDLVALADFEAKEVLDVAA